ncbi:MAG: ThiF family adenylyltransferase [Candidatus Poribacteria bacterium]|nr:ThiF family adenylyltransferase [Candidatus Poribacteria bacterium]
MAKPRTAPHDGSLRAHFYSDSITPQQVVADAQHLPEPDETHVVGNATVSLYLAKGLHDPKWRHDALETMTRHARQSYRRYGDVALVDDYDDKAMVVLARATYVVAPEAPGMLAEEWLCARFIPYDGLPEGTSDFDNCVCKEAPLASVVQSAIFGDDKKQMSRVASVSRVCSIRPYTISNVSSDWLDCPKLRYASSSFALINRYGLMRQAMTEETPWTYLTAQFRPEAVGGSFVVRAESGEFFPTFTPAAERLNLASPRDIRVNRDAEAYQYPTYFLDTRGLLATLARMLEEGALSEETMRHHLGIDTSFDEYAQTGLKEIERLRRLGELLTVEGDLHAAAITADELRARIDHEVGDGSSLFIMDIGHWLESVNVALEASERAAKPRTSAPTLLNASEAHRYRRVVYDEAGNATLREDDGTRHIIPASQQYDVTQATIFGLNERLTMSAISPKADNEATLRERFNDEWLRYAEAMMRSDGAGLDYGVYAYYPDANELVHYCPRYWHRVVSVASNSKLIADPKGELSWREIRGVFEETVVAVAGGSVGSNILHSVVMDLRPNDVKIADKSVFKMENINRVRLGYKDIVRNNELRRNPMDLMLRNKAQVAASQLYAIDPYVNVHVYDGGITEATIARFFEGDEDESATTFLVEEIDDPRMKVRLREEARKRGIPVLMMTDVGSCVQLDLMRYDLDPTFPLAYGTSDDYLHDATNAVYDRGGDRDAFFAFVDALIGTDYRQDELNDILNGNSEVPTSTIIPQLGSTAAMAGAIAAETIARIQLGEEYPPRVLINKRTFEVKRYA